MLYFVNFKELSREERKVFKKMRKIASISGGEQAGYSVYLDSTNKGTASVKISNGQFNYFPDDLASREIIYIAGPSGAGKSYWAGNYIKEYTKQFPENDIILFSPVEQDDALDAHDPERPLQESKYSENEIKLEEIPDSLVIFDDCESLSGADSKPVMQLQNTIAVRGRHTGTSMVVINHLLTNYKQTRVILNESTCIVFYPKSGSTYHIQRYLQSNIGLPKNIIQKILNLPGRAVLLSKTSPMFVLSEHEIFLIHSS